MVPDCRNKYFLTIAQKKSLEKFESVVLQFAVIGCFYHLLYYVTTNRALPLPPTPKKSVSGPWQFCIAENTLGVAREAPTRSIAYCPCSEISIACHLKMKQKPSVVP